MCTRPVTRQDLLRPRLPVADATTGGDSPTEASLTTGLAAFEHPLGVDLGGQLSGGSIGLAPTAHQRHAGERRQAETKGSRGCWRMTQTLCRSRISMTAASRVPSTRSGPLSWSRNTFTAGFSVISLPLQTRLLPCSYTHYGSSCWFAGTVNSLPSGEGRSRIGPHARETTEALTRSNYHT